MRLVCFIKLHLSVKEADYRGRKLYLELRQWTEKLLTDWRNLKLFATPPARRLSFYVALVVLWKEIKSWRWIYVLSPLCFGLSYQYFDVKLRNYGEHDLKFGNENVHRFKVGGGGIRL